MNKTQRALVMGIVSSCIVCFFATKPLPGQSGGYDGLEAGYGGESISYGSEDEAEAGFGSSQVRQEKVRKTRATGGGGPGMPAGGGGLGGGFGGAPRGGPAGLGASQRGIGAEEDDFEEDETGYGMGMQAPGAPGGGMGMGMGGLRGPQQVKLILQMYPVGDLLKRPTDRPFDGFVLPGLSGQNRFPMSGQGGGGFGGGGAIGGFGGGGASGGGLFAVPSSPRIQLGGGMGMGGYEDDEGYGGIGMSRSYSSNSNSISVSDLMRAIVSAVTPSSWDARGGPGTIANLGEVLIVNQTEEVHQQIGLFLNMLSETNKRKPSVTIKAIWLTINEEIFQSLDIERDQQVNSKVLAQLVKSHGQRGQVTCFDGQTVHIAAGNLKSTIESVVPVVGQNEIDSRSERIAFQNDASRKLPSKPIPSHVMAQSLGGDDAVSGDSADQSAIGYQPISRWINYGAVLQLTPKVDADQKMLTLSVSSTLVVSGDEESFEKLVMGTIGLDGHDLRCQQFQSNVRLKNSTPTLVGGSAFQSTGSEDQTYLIIEAIVNND